MGRFFLIVGAPLGLLCATLAEDKTASPGKAWTLTDFGGVLSVGLEGHRNFDKGRRHFVSHCAGCHQLKAIGGGPARDLSKLSLTYSPEELLGRVLSFEAHPRKPNGLLDDLSQEDVLDLLAFILSGADPQSSFFFHP